LLKEASFMPGQTHRTRSKPCSITEQKFSLKFEILAEVGVEMEIIIHVKCALP